MAQLRVHAGVYVLNHPEDLRAIVEVYYDGLVLQPAKERPQSLHGAKSESRDQIIKVSTRATKLVRARTLKGISGTKSNPKQNTFYIPSRATPLPSSPPTLNHPAGMTTIHLQYVIYLKSLRVNDKFCNFVFLKNALIIFYVSKKIQIPAPLGTNSFLRRIMIMTLFKPSAPRKTDTSTAPPPE